MKKIVLIWLLAMAILASGCAASNTHIPQTTDATTAGTTEQRETEAATEATTEATEPSATEETAAANTQAQTEPAVTDDSREDYLAAIEEQSNQIRERLQQDTLKQSEMNQLVQQLYELWDGALNDLWGKLRDSLPEEEFDKLLDEQLQWIEDKENAVQEAGKDYEGGSLYPLITISEAADITQERVYELYELWKDNS